MITQTITLPKFTTAGVHTLPNTGDIRHFIISVHADASTTATIRVKGSAIEAPPDFSAASTSSNDWDYLAIRELATANLIAGATGATVSASTIHKLYEVECNGLNHFGIDVSSISGDGITVNVFLKQE